MQLYANNASSTLAAGVNVTDNTLVLAAGQGSLFPAPTGGDFFLLTLTQGVGLEASWEIVKCTARSGDSLTVVRAQESTAGAVWPTGSKVELRLTKDSMDAKANFVWGSVKTSAFTADNGGVYACNTSAGAFVASLPANPQPGWVATFLDYAGTFDVSSLTVSRNGSNIGGVADDYLLDQKNIGRNFVYADSTKGWLVK